MHTIQKVTSMGNRMIMVICLWTALYIVVSANNKSHNMWITRVDKPALNNSWIELQHMELRKLSRNVKVLSMNFTTLGDLDTDDILCEIKVHQKIGSKYLKAPLDFPKQPCCNLFKNKATWGCMQKKSSLPQACPVKKGKYWIKDFNPDDCNPADNLPSHLPEDYRMSVKVTNGPEQIVSFVSYGKLKKKMTLN